MMKIQNRLLWLAIMMLLSLGACGERTSLEFVSPKENEDTYNQEEVLPKMTEIMVYVCGAVEAPGVYSLTEKDRVVDAITLAGGVTEQAAEEYLNLAAFLQDGQKLYVPTVDEVRLWETEEEKKKLVNINTADVEGLCTLPGIGESKARDIITYREKQGSFEQVEDIMKVPGIKEYLFLKIEDYITIE
jgi:competence protein ComEA